MKYLNITSYLFAFLLLFGTVFIVQCDRDTQQADRDDQYQTEQDIAVDEEDRRYDGTGDEGIADEQLDHTMEFDDRNDLTERIEDLRDDLDSKIEEGSDATDQDVEQLQNDRTELDRILQDIENTTEDSWNNVRTEAIQTYERIAARYNEQSTTDNDNW